MRGRSRGQQYLIARGCVRGCVIYLTGEQLTINAHQKEIFLVMTSQCVQPILCQSVSSSLLASPASRSRRLQTCYDAIVATKCYLPSRLFQQRTAYRHIFSGFPIPGDPSSDGIPNVSIFTTLSLVWHVSGTYTGWPGYLYSFWPHGDINLFRKTGPHPIQLLRAPGRHLCWCRWIFLDYMKFYAHAPRWL